METYTNQTKSPSPFASEAITGVDLWDDPNVAWDAPLFAWDVDKTDWADLQKPEISSSTTSNPFFLWLFYFTQPQTTETGTAWSNQNKQ